MKIYDYENDPTLRNKVEEIIKNLATIEKERIPLNNNTITIIGNNTVESVTIDLKIQDE